jgi:hypothetical protein
MPINVGGNDSVQWVVNVQRAREAYSDPPPQPGGPKPYYHEGVDETDPDHYFAITIRAPRNGAQLAAFIDALARELSLPNGVTPKINGGVLRMTLPIEDRQHPNGPNHDQIKIDW